MIFLQVLSVDTLDGSPTLVLSTEKRRFLFDIGEGVQRLCMEHRVRLVKLDTVFMTRVVPETISGLPGLFLTAADSGGQAHLSLVGPAKLQQFWDSLHHFTHRPNFEMQITELGSDKDNATEIRFDDEGVTVTCVAFAATSSSSPSLSSSSSSVATHVCYICEMPSQVGKFDVQRANALGVPKGPAYGKLKNGETITLENGNQIRPEQVLEESEPGRFCAIVCNVANTTGDEDILAQIAAHQIWKKFQLGGECEGRMECIIHLSSSSVLSSAEYSGFMLAFPPLKHFAAGAGACQPLSSFVAATRYSNKLHSICPSIFSKLALGDASAALASDSFVIPCTPLMKYHLFPSKRRGLELPPSVDLDKDVEVFIEELQKNENFNLTVAQARDMEAKTNMASAESDILTSASVSNSEGERKLQSAKNHHLYFLGTGCAVPSKYRNVSGILLRLPPVGTTEPCNLINSLGSCILLDAGEGTWQQMVRTVEHLPGTATIRCGVGATGSFESIPVSDRTGVLLALQLKLVWISHPHADHHLGLIRIIVERKRLSDLYSEVTKIEFEPLVVIAPSSVLRFLFDYANNVQSLMKSAYVPVYCSALDPHDEAHFSPLLQKCSDKPADESAIDAETMDVEEVAAVLSKGTKWSESNVAIAQRVWQSMGIEAITNVRVEHCNQSYGVSIIGAANSFKLVYSGDTRPCAALVELGMDATILIHEATFDDDCSEDAVSKRHCSVSEALEVGIKMNAFRVILTHFSQRYPNVPPMPADHAALLAFDYMHLSFTDLIWAPAITAALSEAFPPAQEDDEDGITASKKRAAESCACGCLESLEFCSMTNPSETTVVKGSARAMKMKRDSNYEQIV